MLNLAEYRQRPALLADWLPWAGLVAPGVVLNKDGSFQRTFQFRGPDLDSATQGELIATSARQNNALRRTGSGWAFYIEAERMRASSYPQSSFPEPLSWLVDEERRAAFEESDGHFESVYHFTLQHLPPQESRARAAGMLYENRPTEGVDWRGRLDSFVAETDRVFDLLDGVMPEIAWLDDSQTLTYLHATVSTRRYRVGVPDVPFHIDALLADAALVGGLAPMLGDQHLRVVSVRGFPTSTWPGILDDLNRLGFAYRWSTRFLCLDKAEAERELGRLRRQWFAKRKNVIALLRETIFQQESPLVDTDASNKAADADAALQELGSDQVAFGYLTATVTVLDADPAVADEKLRMVERVIQGRGFVTIPETLNAVDAWLSSVPGNAYANVRQPIVSTLNLAHMMPMSAVWAGPEKNEHLDGPPLIVTRTDGATPFRLVTHIGDVGHTLVAGPTGMGKSVLLAILAMQFRRYFGSRIFAFDMGRSMRATIFGLGGEHYDLGADGGIAFQPLARIAHEGYRTWAAEWVEGRLLHEGVTVGPDEKAAIWSALRSLAGAPVEQRTMTGLSVLLQFNALRQALAPYVLGGAHGKLLDADHDRLGMADVQGFEMEELMHSPAAVQAVLRYLFARFDERFDGAPTLLILDEAWLFLNEPSFAARIRQWLKTLRKKNVSVIFATQSLADIKDSTIAPAIIESCASRIFLPNPQATEPQIRTIYEGFGLSSRQIEIVATAQPKRDYYYQSRLGNRLFDLDLGPVAGGGGGGGARLMSFRYIGILQTLGERQHRGGQFVGVYDLPEAFVHVEQRVHALGHGERGFLFHFAQRGDVVVGRGQSYAFEHRGRELHGRSRRHHDRGRVVVALLAVLREHVERDCGMRIAQIAVFVVDVAQRVGVIVLQRIAAPERFAYLAQAFAADVIAACGAQFVHPGAHGVAVAACELEQQTLEIGRDEYVHGRGRRFDELAVERVHSGIQEICQHFVVVGRAYKLANGQTHEFGVVRREYVAEVARRHAEIHFVAVLDLSGRKQIGVCREIISHLGSEPAEVDGVGARHLAAGRGELFFKLRVAERFLDRRLRVVEIAAHRHHFDVVAERGNHLTALGVADTAVGIEHYHRRAVHARKAFERGLAGVAARGYGNKAGFLLPRLGFERGHEQRKHGQRHVLEGVRPAVPQFEHVQPAVQLDLGRGVAVERRVSAARDVEQFVLRQFVEKFRHDEGGTLGVIHIRHPLDILAAHRRERFGNVQSAVGSQPGEHRGRARNGQLVVSGRSVIHKVLVTDIFSGIWEACRRSRKRRCPRRDFRTGLPVR